MVPSARSSIGIVVGLQDLESGLQRSILIKGYVYIDLVQSNSLNEDIYSLLNLLSRPIERKAVPDVPLYSRHKWVIRYEVLTNNKFGFFASAYEDGWTSSPSHLSTDSMWSVYSS